MFFLVSLIMHMAGSTIDNIFDCSSNEHTNSRLHEKKQAGAIHQSCGASIDYPKNLRSNECVYDFYFDWIGRERSEPAWKPTSSHMCYPFGRVSIDDSPSQSSVKNCFVNGIYASGCHQLRRHEATRTAWIPPSPSSNELFSKISPGISKTRRCREFILLMKARERFIRKGLMK
jgi:hypothetical protein